MLKLCNLTIIFFFIAFSLSGCSFEKKVPEKYSFHFIRNNDYDLPIKVHVLLMKNYFKFMTGDFYDLQRDAKDVLGEDFISETTFFSLPFKKHESYLIVLEPPLPSSIYIGLIAEYINFPEKKWRLSSPLPPYPNTFSGAIYNKDTLIVDIVIDYQGLHINYLKRK